MKREDIEKAADEYSEQDLERFKHDEYWEYLADELVCGAREDANIGAFIAGAEWMHEHNKYLDVHTDNSEVIANMQAEIEKLKSEKEQMITKASKWLNENADNYISKYCKCMEFGFVVMFERAMRGE